MTQEDRMLQYEAERQWNIMLSLSRKRRRIRTRWCLAMTLLHNPQLRELRKETGRRHRSDVTLRRRRSLIWRLQREKDELFSESKTEGSESICSCNRHTPTSISSRLMMDKLGNHGCESRCSTHSEESCKISDHVSRQTTQGIHHHGNCECELEIECCRNVLGYPLTSHPNGQLVDWEATAQHHMQHLRGIRSDDSNTKRLTLSERNIQCIRNRQNIDSDGNYYGKLCNEDVRLNQDQYEDDSSDCQSVIIRAHDDDITDDGVYSEILCSSHQSDSPHSFKGRITNLRGVFQTLRDGLDSVAGKLYSTTSQLPHPTSAGLAIKTHANENDANHDSDKQQELFHIKTTDTSDYKTNHSACLSTSFISSQDDAPPKHCRTVGNGIMHKQAQVHVCDAQSYRETCPVPATNGIKNHANIGLLIQQNDRCFRNMESSDSTFPEGINISHSALPNSAGMSSCLSANRQKMPSSKGNNDKKIDTNTLPVSKQSQLDKQHFVKTRTSIPVEPSSATSINSGFDYWPGLTRLADEYRRNDCWSNQQEQAHNQEIYHQSLGEGLQERRCLQDCDENFVQGCSCSHEPLTSGNKHHFHHKKLKCGDMENSLVMVRRQRLQRQRAVTGIDHNQEHSFESMRTICGVTCAASVSESQEITQRRQLQQPLREMSAENILHFQEDASELEPGNFETFDFDDDGASQSPMSSSSADSFSTGSAKNTPIDMSSLSLSQPPSPAGILTTSNVKFIRGWLHYKSAFTVMPQ